MLLATSHSPPRGCVIARLLAIDGENWVKLALLEYPGLLMQAKRQAKGCQACADTLQQLFPDGIPEHDDLGEFTVQELEKIFEVLTNQDGGNDHHVNPPGSEPGGGDG